MIDNLKLDDQSYEQMVETARKAIRKYAPDWTDENAHDPGITLIELFAWLTEMLSYYMDQTTEALAYTYLALLGFPRAFGLPATCYCAVKSTEKMTLEVGQKFYKGRFCFEITEPSTHAPFEINEIISMDANWAPRDLKVRLDNGLSVYPFGRTGEKRTRPAFEIRFNRAASYAEGLKLYFKMGDWGMPRNPITAPERFVPLGRIVWETFDGSYWHEMSAVEDGTYGLLEDGCICFKSETSEALAIRATLVDDAYDLMPKLVGVDTHIVKLAQTDTLEDVLYLDGSGLPGQQVALPYHDLYMPQLKVAVQNEAGEWQPWRFTSSLYEGHGMSKIFTLDSDTQTLCFGDGINGDVPEKGIANIRISHMVRTSLEQGNILLDVLEHPELNFELKALTHATGGVPVDTLERLKAKLYGQKQHLHIAVTAEDYEHIASEAQGLLIERVKCLPLYKPGLKHYPKVYAENSVSVLVVPFGLEEKRALNPAYLANLKALFSASKMLTTEVHVINPTYYEMTLHLEGRFQGPMGQLAQSIRDTMRVSKFFDFGKPILISALHQLLLGIEGVQNIDYLALTCRQSVSRNKRGDMNIPPDGIGLLVGVEINEA